MTLLLDKTAVRLREVGVVRVTGPDRLTYLHTLLSQDLAGSRPGDVADFLHLDAKGGIRAMGRAVVHAEAVLLVTPPVVATPLSAALEQFKFLLDVAADDVSASWGLASVRGPGDVVVPGARSEPMTAAPHGDGLVVRDRSGGADLLGTSGWVADRVAGLGLPGADRADWDAWRITAGIPAWGSEVVEGRRAQELGLLPTHVHLQKGCYPGQESIAKIHNLGRPRRALVVAHFDGAVSAGDAVIAGEGTGEVTSAASVADGTAALALLPVDRVTGDVRGAGAIEAGRIPGRVVRRVGAGLPQPGELVIRARARP
jgi:folate-binding protein YgfZ